MAYLDYNGLEYLKGKLDDTYETIADANDLKSAKPLFLSADQIPDNIPNDTDYDTILTPGSYRSSSASDVATMTNCPAVAAHRLEVYQSAYHTSRFFQFITENGSPVNQYKRYYNGSSWSSWLKIADTSYVDAVESEFIRAGGFDYNKLSTSDLTNYGLANTKKWTTSSNQRSYTFRIPPNVKKIKVKANATGDIIAFLNSYAPVSGQLADFASGYDGRISLAGDEEQTYTVKGNMNYMFCLVKDTSGNDKIPALTLYCTNNILESVDTEAADESAMHDRKSEITVMLNAFGECKLSQGVFYTSANLYMPQGSKLEGSGDVTVLKLLASATSGSALVMGAYCTARDLTVKGGDSTQWGNGSEGTRNGIEWTGENQFEGTVENCNVLNFDGAGIYLHDTTQKTYRNLSIANCYITGNYIGVDIRKDSEFNKIANCTVIGNGIGYRNRGGNNDIANSGLDANKTGILIDADVGSNNGHGTITGCSINHSNSNNGYGLIIKDTGRMLVSNCNFYYSKIKLDTTNGNVISGCGFGNAAAWEITDGDCSLFIGCMVRGWGSDNSPVTITNNSAVKIINCYDRNGTINT